jgi:phosphoglycerol transferase
MKLWRADLRIPFTYFGDALYYSVATKGAIEQGWWFHNSSLGAPNGLKFEAFPAIDNFPFLLIKAISIFNSDQALTLNLFYLLTFPLTTLTSLYFFRYFKFSYGPSILASLLYTFLPYHFFRSYHLFLAAYYPLPLMILVILWVCAGVPLMVDYRENRGWPKLRWRSFEVIFSFVVCAIVGSCGIYYPFFSCFLLLVAGIWAGVQQRNIRALMAPIVLISFISAVVLLNHLPTIMYQQTHGTSAAGGRSVADAETMGLKITQLLLPIGGHRVTALGALKYRYDMVPLVNENDTASLGIVGSIGFLVLLFRLFHKKAHHSILNHLSVLNGSALLLGTIGGFGALFALFISPQIRAYNRISVFIAFFSLVAVAQILDTFYKNLKDRRARLTYFLIPSALIVAGVFDQTSTTFFFVPEYDNIKNEYQSDSDFVHGIEASLPPRAMIFQLPYIAFPANAPVNKMVQDHEHFKAYLHSKALRWSYGATIGEKDDLWQKEVAAKPVGDLVQEISRAGFLGIYINRDGYADGAIALEAELTALLGAKPAVSRKANLIFFNLMEYNNHLKGSQQLSEARNYFGASKLVKTFSDPPRQCSYGPGYLRRLRTRAAFDT